VAGVMAGHYRLFETRVQPGNVRVSNFSKSGGSQGIGAGALGGLRLGDSWGRKRCRCPLDVLPR
jgi:hypothetical protein